MMHECCYAIVCRGLQHERHGMSYHKSRCEGFHGITVRHGCSQDSLHGIKAPPVAAVPGYTPPCEEALTGSNSLGTSCWSWIAMLLSHSCCSCCMASSSASQVQFLVDRWAQTRLQDRQYAGATSLTNDVRMPRCIGILPIRASMLLSKGFQYLGQHAALVCVAQAIHKQCLAAIYEVWHTIKKLTTFQNAGIAWAGLFSEQQRMYGELGADTAARPYIWCVIVKA